MIVPFKKKEDNDKVVSLSDWYMHHHSEDERRVLFVSLHKTLKYIHDRGYCIAVFYPSVILVLYDNPEYIQFTKLMEMPLDIDKQREIIREDIFNACFIQIGLYSNTLAKLNPDFLMDNFDSFTEFLPPGDVSYYRGVIQRGASVYFCQFDVEKAKKEFADLQKQFGEIDNQGPSTLPDSSEEELTNKKINDVIYKQINGLRDAAFVHTFIIPAILIIIITLFGVVSWFISILS